MLLSGMVLSFPAPLLAQQAPPDAGSIMRDIEDLRAPTRPQLPPSVVPEAPEPPPADAVTFVVERFELSGVTLVSEELVQAVLEPWLNRELTFDDLNRALAAISELYQAKGWFARPQLPAQDIVDGTVLINVIEGRFGAVQLGEDADVALDESRIEGFMTQRQASGDYLNMSALSRSINLLNSQPGVAASVAMATSETPGASDLVVMTEALPRYGASVMMDNSGSRSTGRERATFSGNLNNPLRIGDRVSTTALITEGNRYLQLGYERPVGFDGWRVSGAWSLLDYELINEFAEIGVTGQAQTVSLTADYPLIWTTQSNTRLSMTLSDAHYDDAVGPAETKKRVTSASIALNGDASDGFFGGGFTQWGTSVDAGQVELKDPEQREVDELGPGTHGDFSKVAANLARLQRITERSTLWLSVNGQIAGNNLDSSQGFSLGGPAGVRAYPASEASGDQGLRLTIEARQNLTDRLQGTVFYDYGRIWVNQDDSWLSESETPNVYALEGAGVSLSMTISPRLQVSATAAQRIGDNPAANPETGADGDGTKRDTQVWLSLTASF